MPVDVTGSVNYTSHRLFANIGQTYESAMLLFAVQQLDVRIKGNKRLYLDKWLANEEVDLKIAFDKNNTSDMFKIIKHRLCCRNREVSLRNFESSHGVLNDRSEERVGELVFLFLDFILTLCSQLQSSKPLFSIDILELRKVLLGIAHPPVFQGDFKGRRILHI